MKLAAISSSPIKAGSSERLVLHMVDCAEQLGCRAQRFDLSRMTIKLCTHCTHAFQNINKIDIVH